MSVEFHSTNGSLWPLEYRDSPGVFATQGSLQGLYEPTFEMFLEKRVGADGSVLAGQRQGERRVMMSFHIDPEVVGSPLRTWSALLSAFAAGGLFRYTADDGQVRVMRNVTIEASTTTSALKTVSNEIHTANLTVVALDPWWYGPAEVVPLVIVGDSIVWSPALPWNAPLPWNGGATVTFDVYGDAAAYPVIDIYGPSTEVSVGVVGGSSWRSLQVLTAGQRLTMDHRPGTIGPTLQGEASPRWSLLTEASRPWVLPVGQRTVTVLVAGETSATNATLTWEPRWLTP